MGVFHATGNTYDRYNLIPQWMGYMGSVVHTLLIHPTIYSLLDFHHLYLGSPVWIGRDP
jgi:hypothetical protein